ncbi:oxidoreductase [Asanoa siamensis]|uniref:Fido domain-containing protein n=1 Tax=Asanoa siamensis TaxID=926357 RepID=A0ABQ4CT91_9ACTN|nr:oxidoreductase [Asanoa siamensis]GIF74062.1 hypothetical protein Asi02nite_35800 [Asanoa siamensis]
MLADPLAPLLALADVQSAVTSAREAADAAMRHRALRRQGGAVAAEVSLRSAVASAALAGHGYDREQVRAGVVTDPVVQGCLRVASALPSLAETWVKAPRQVLARLHVLAFRGAVPADQLGHPVAGFSAGSRLDALASLVAGGTSAPPLVLAAVVHGELLTLRPFAGEPGVVARAAARLTLMSSGFDPRGLIAPEIGHLAREPECVGAAGAFATGTPDGVRSWLRHCFTAVSLGASALTEAAEETWTAPQG